MRNSLTILKFFLVEMKVLHCVGICLFFEASAMGNNLNVVIIIIIMNQFKNSISRLRGCELRSMYTLLKKTKNNILSGFLQCTNKTNKNKTKQKNKKKKHTHKTTTTKKKKKKKNQKKKKKKKNHVIMLQIRHSLGHSVCITLYSGLAARAETGQADA